jgi:hypothetical protein
MRPATQLSVLWLLLVLSGCASTPKTVMLVPSRETVPKLEALSHNANTLVDVLTVGREVHTFLLDGVGGGALTGLEQAAGPATRLSFDELALVYSTSGPSLFKETYPLLPAVAPANAVKGNAETAKSDASGTALSAGGGQAGKGDRAR